MGHHERLHRHRRVVEHQSRGRRRPDRRGAVRHRLGLVAAIPAVIAYNKLSGDANKMIGRLEGFADEFSTILSRQLEARGAR